MSQFPMGSPGAYGFPQAPAPAQGFPQQYGAPQPYGYGPAAPGPSAHAMTQQPGVADLGGQGGQAPAWYRMAFFPTSPFYSTNPQVGYQIRYYSGGILNQTANSEVIATVQFDLPCRIIAINGSCFPTTGTAFTVGTGPRDQFLFRAEYVQGDRLHISARLGSTVVGTAERPGELGGTGYTVDTGGALLLGITPLVANLRIDITLHCLELRGPRNFHQR